MKIMSFTSIEDLNAFLAGEGVGKDATDGISEAIRDAIGQAGEPLAGDQQGSPEEATSQDGLGNFDAYIEVTSEKIAVLVKERAILERMYNEERASHVACHEQFDEVLQGMYLRGWSESIAAGLYPMVPFDRLPEEVRAAIINQAKNSMARMDEIASKTNR